MEVWQTSNLRRLRLGEEKKERKNKSQHENIMVCLLQGDHNQWYSLLMVWMLFKLVNKTNTDLQFVKLQHRVQHWTEHNVATQCSTLTGCHKNTILVINFIQRHTAICRSAPNNGRPLSVSQLVQFTACHTKHNNNNIRCTTAIMQQKFPT